MARMPPSRLPREPWRRNQIAVNVAAAMVFLGFTLVTPFMPFFVRSLGVDGDARVALWSGVLLSAAPLLASVLGPLWGRLAETVGMKVMVQRVLFTIAAHWGLMYFTRNVWQVLALRVLLGLFSGFGTMSVALVTHGCPRERIGRAVGALQATQITSAAIGPFVGGLLAGTIGVRRAYLVTFALSALALLFVILLYRDLPAAAGTSTAPAGGEPEAAVVVSQAGPVTQGVRALVPRPGRGAPRPPGLSFRDIIRLPLFLPLLPILFLVNMVDRSMFLVVPLFVAAPFLNVRSVEATTGVVMSGAALTEATSAYLLGRLAGRRIAATRILLSCLTGGTVLILLLAVTRTLATFAVTRILLGVAMGGAPTVAYTLAGEVIPDSVRASSYALLSSTAMLGASLGPTMTGALCAIHLRAPLVVGGLTYALLALHTLVLVRRQASGPAPWSSSAMAARP